MNAILDIIILAIAALTIYFAVKNGFVKTLLSASAFLIAVVITVTLFTPVKNAFMGTSAADKVRDRVESTIENILTNNEVENDDEINALLDKKSGADDFFKVLDDAGIKREVLKAKVDEWKSEAGVNLKEKLVSYIADPIVNALVTATIVAILFFGSLIIIKIVTYILDKVCRLPVLKTANKLLGIILGVLLALVRIYLFCILVKILLPYGLALDIGIFGAINPDNTLLFKLFYNFNIFGFLL